jgi:hypothetical protein
MNRKRVTIANVARQPPINVERDADPDSPDSVSRNDTERNDVEQVHPRRDVRSDVERDEARETDNDVEHLPKRTR